MLILLNGPPGAGKSTMAKCFETAGVGTLKLNKPFWDFVKDALVVSEDQMIQGKDEPLQAMGFKGPIRKALIAAADAVELVDPTVWIRRALVDLPKGNAKKLWVIDALGKNEQYDWVKFWDVSPSFMIKVARSKLVFEHVPSSEWHLLKTGESSFRFPKFSDGRDNIRYDSASTRHTGCEFLNVGTPQQMQDWVDDFCRQLFLKLGKEAFEY